MVGEEKLLAGGGGEGGFRALWGWLTSPESAHDTASMATPVSVA